LRAGRDPASTEASAARASPSKRGTSRGSPTTTSRGTGKGRKPQGSTKPAPQYSGMVNLRHNRQRRGTQTPWAKHAGQRRRS
jgi:hypothetical protein